MLKDLIMILLFIVLVLGIIKSFRRKNRKKLQRRKTEDHVVFDNNENYKVKLRQNLQPDFKEYFDRIEQWLSEMRNIIIRYGDKLTVENKDINAYIFDYAEKIESLIGECWSNAQIRKNFYNCIALHYASFSLADHIKMEQLKIKENLVTVLKYVEALHNRIEQLNVIIPQRKGKEKYAYQQEHSSLCAEHKRFSRLKNMIGATNKEYHSRLSEQNMRTEERRDYIINNFGERGKRWGERLSRNKEDFR